MINVDITACSFLTGNTECLNLLDITHQCLLIAENALRYNPRAYSLLGKPPSKSTTCMLSVLSYTMEYSISF